MAENKTDKYLYGEIENKVFIKFVGNCTMKNSKTLEDLVKKILEGEKKDIILDLEECNYMDSTMLGLIAKITIKIKQMWQKNIYALNTPNIINASFKSTGVSKLIEMIENKEENNIKVEELEIKDFDDKEAKTRHILEAHKTLIGLSEENAKAFKNVVTLLERELSN